MTEQPLSTNLACFATQRPNQVEFRNRPRFSLTSSSLSHIYIFFTPYCPVFPFRVNKVTDTLCRLYLCRFWFCLLASKRIRLKIVLTIMLSSLFALLYIIDKLISISSSLLACVTVVTLIILKLYYFIRNGRYYLNKR